MLRHVMKASLFLSLATSVGACRDTGASGKVAQIDVNTGIATIGLMAEIEGDLKGLYLGSLDKVKIKGTITMPADAAERPGEAAALDGNPESVDVTQLFGGFNANGDRGDESMANILYFSQKVRTAFKPAGAQISENDYGWRLEVEAVEGYQCTLTPSSGKIADVSTSSNTTGFTIQSSCKHPYGDGKGLIKGHKETVILKLADGSSLSIDPAASLTSGVEFSVKSGALTSFAVEAVSEEERARRLELAKEKFSIAKRKGDGSDFGYGGSTPDFKVDAFEARGHLVEVEKAPAGQKCTIKSVALEAVTYFQAIDSEGEDDPERAVLREPVAPSADAMIEILCEDGPAVRGTITDLHGEIVLQLGGTDELTVSTTAKASKSFVFPKVVKDGDSYAVTIKTQPAHQTCTVSGGVDNVGEGKSVSIACAYNTYSIGGSVSGQSGAFTLSYGTGTVSVGASDTSYSIPGLQALAAHSVSVSVQPAGQTCTVGAAGTQTSLTGNITGANITCTNNPAPTYTLRANVSGLSGGTLTLRNQINLNTLSITANGLHSFSSAITSGDGYDYDVRVLGQPAGQNCSLSGDVGTASANVTVTVTCSATPSTYTVSGIVQDIPAGMNLVLRMTYGPSNDTEDLTVNYDFMSNPVSFTFTEGLSNGTAYSISVQTQPMGATCTVTAGGSGTISGADVTGVSVSCN